MRNSKLLHFSFVVIFPTFVRLRLTFFPSFSTVPYTRTVLFSKPSSSSSPLPPSFLSQLLNPQHILRCCFCLAALFVIRSSFAAANKSICRRNNQTWPGQIARTHITHGPDPFPPLNLRRPRLCVPSHQTLCVSVCGHWQHRVFFISFDFKWKPILNCAAFIFSAVQSPMVRFFF